MAKRKVTHSGKDENNVITKLCNHGEWWSPRSKDDAIDDIELNRHSYYVSMNSETVDIHVVNVNGKKHLRTDRDGKGKNNLEELPDC